MSENHFINHLEQPVGWPLPSFAAPAFPENKPMEGAFCRLIPLDAGKHAETLFANYAQDKQGANWTYLPYGPFDDFSSYSSWLREMEAGTDPQFYTVETAKHSFCGVASYLRITPVHGSIEVGHIHFSPVLQNTPASTEAMHLMMSRAFNMGYRRYEWKCDALNAPSRKAALRLGFTFEGIFRQAAVNKNRNRDTAWYSIIDSEWPAIDQAFKQWLAPSNFDSNGHRLRPLQSYFKPQAPKT